MITVKKNFKSFSSLSIVESLKIMTIVATEIRDSIPRVTFNCCFTFRCYIIEYFLGSTFHYSFHLSNIDKSVVTKAFHFTFAWKVFELFPIIFTFSVIFFHFSPSAASILVSLLKSRTSMAPNWFFFLPWKFAINKIV